MRCIGLRHYNRMAMFARDEFDSSQVQILCNERRKFPLEKCRDEIITVHRCRRFLSRVFLRLEALAMTFEFIGNGQGDGQHNRGSSGVIDPHGEKCRDAHQSSHGPSRQAAGMKGEGDGDPYHFADVPTSVRTNRAMRRWRLTDSTAYANDMLPKNSVMISLK